jgi:hypothetical protein
MKRFEDTMYKLGFIDRSPFLRMLIDYIYNHRVRPVDAEVISGVRNDVEGLGYRVESIVPVLDGKIFVLIAKRRKKLGGKSQATKQEAE